MAGESVRKFSVRKPTWISFRAGPQGGPGCRGERELGHTVAASSVERFALSGHLWKVGWGTGVISLLQVRDEQVSVVIMR